MLVNQRGFAVQHTLSRVCLKFAKSRNRTSEVQVTPVAASAANDDRGAQLLRDGYADLHSIHSCQ